MYRYMHGRRSWGMRGMHPPTIEAGEWPVQSPPYKEDEQMKSILKSLLQKRLYHT